MDNNEKYKHIVDLSNILTSKGIEHTTIKGGILIHADCEDILHLIPNGVVDIVLTDPPYNIGYSDWDSFVNIHSITQSLHRVLKKEGSLFMFAGWSFVCNVISQFYNEFTLKDWIIYDRVKGRGAKRRLVSTREDLLWYVKSENYTFNKDNAYSTIVKKTKGMGTKNGRDTRALSNVWTDISPIVPWSAERNAHPTQKPVQLCNRILTVFSNRTDLVLDCYSGSGSTLEAAIILGNSFIGIEKNKDYYELSKKRLENIE